MRAIGRGGKETDPFLNTGKRVELDLATCKERLAKYLLRYKEFRHEQIGRLLVEYDFHPLSFFLLLANLLTIRARTWVELQ